MRYPMSSDKLKRDIADLKGDVAYLNRKLKRLKFAGRDDFDLEVRSVENILGTKENILEQQKELLAKLEKANG